MPFYKHHTQECCYTIQVGFQVACQTVKAVSAKSTYVNQVKSDLMLSPKPVRCNKLVVSLNKWTWHMALVQFDKQPQNLFSNAVPCTPLLNHVRTNKS